MVERTILRYNRDGKKNLFFGARVTGENDIDTLSKARTMVNGMVRVSKRWRGTEHELYRNNFRILKAIYYEEVATEGEERRKII